MELVSQANPAKGIFEMDLVFTSTLTTALQIEIFGAEASQFIVINSAVNDYVPVSAFYLGKAGAAGIFASLKGGTANQYMSGTIMGSNDIYINAGGITSLGTIKNCCFFDQNGNAVYQPGMVVDVQTAGNVTISCTTQNTNYRHIFDWSKNNTFELHSAMMEFSESAQIASNLIYTTRNVNGLTDADPVTIKGSKSNLQFNPLLLNPMISKKMRPSNSFRYNMLAFTTGASQVVTTNFFYSVIDEIESLRQGSKVFKGNRAL